jgi:hypothetical protein
MFERLSRRDDNAMTRVGLPAVGTIVDAPGIDIDRGTYIGEPAFDFTNSFGNMTTFIGEVDISDRATFELAIRRTNVTFDQAETARTLGPVDLATATVERRGQRQLIVDEDQWLARGAFKLDLDTGPINHRITTGGEFFEYDLFLDFNVPGAPGPINVLEPVYDPFFGDDLADIFESSPQEQYREVFFQDVMTYGPFTLTGGFRYVDVEFDGEGLDTVVYQIGGTYRVNEVLSTFAGYNTGYDANSGLAILNSRTGEPFEPEFFSQVEAGVKVEMLANVTGTLSAFRIVRENLLNTDPQDANFSIQTGEEETLGFEGDVVWQRIDRTNAIPEVRSHSPRPADALSFQSPAAPPAPFATDGLLRFQQAYPLSPPPRERGMSDSAASADRGHSRRPCADRAEPRPLHRRPPRPRRRELRAPLLQLPHVPQNPLHHRRVLDRSDHLHLPATPTAPLDLDPKHPLQPLRPRHRLTLRRPRDVPLGPNTRATPACATATPTT